MTGEGETMLINTEKKMISSVPLWKSHI